MILIISLSKRKVIFISDYFDLENSKCKSQTFNFNFAYLQYAKKYMVTNVNHSKAFIRIAAIYSKLRI